jgi:succinate dehydrogenase flavin-adding protein (antitoxin of CptAB toxin-antitoxin module)
MIQPMQDELTKVIAADLGISELPVNEQQELIAQFGEVALKASTLAVVSKLNDDKKDEFAKLAEAGDPVALKTFLDREVPDHEELAKTAVVDEVKRFKNFQAAGTDAGSVADADTGSKP